MKEKRAFVILYDTCGSGLDTFSFGCDGHEEGPELEAGIYRALLEFFGVKDFNDLEQEEIDDALQNYVVLCEVTNITPKVKLSKETVVNTKVDIIV